MESDWKLLDTEPAYPLQPAARTYGMNWGYPKVKVAICHDISKKELFITVHRKDSEDGHWGREPVDAFPLELAEELVGMLEEAKAYLGVKRAAGFKPGDTVQMRDGATQLKIIRTEGPYFILRVLENGVCVGPELKKVLGDLIYVERVGIDEAKNGKDYTVISSVKIDEHAEVKKPVQENGNSTHEAVNRMFMRKEEVEGLTGDEQWFRDLNANAAALEFQEREARGHMVGAGELVEQHARGMQEDMAYLRRKLFAGLGIPDANLVGPPVAEMALQAWTQEDVGWLEQTLRKVLSEKSYSRVSMILRQYTLLHKACKDYLHIRLQATPPVFKCHKHGYQPINFLDGHAACSVCVKEGIKRADEIAKVLGIPASDERGEKFKTEYRGQWQKSPEEDQFPSSGMTRKYTPGKTPASVMLDIAEGRAVVTDHKIEPVPGVMEVEEVPLKWDSKPGLNKNGDELPGFSERTVGSIPLGKTVVDKENLDRALRGSSGAVSMGCSVGRPWCPLCQRSGDDMPYEHVNKLEDGSKYYASEPRFVGTIPMESLVFALTPVRKEDSLKVAHNPTGHQFEDEKCAWCGDSIHAARAQCPEAQQDVTDDEAPTWIRRSKWLPPDNKEKKG